jgi:hypothetical protein
MSRLFWAVGSLVGLLAVMVCVSTLLAGSAGAAIPVSAPVATNTSTATPTSTPCPFYSITQSTATVVSGTVDIGNHCDDCTTVITLPFSYQLYNMSFITATVSSNGNLQFDSNSPRSSITCLPGLDFFYTILPQWGDLVTDCANCGVFTSVSGSAPNRIFNIEWRAAFFEGVPVNFELRLYEGMTEFQVIYGSIPSTGGGAVVGVQKGILGESFTEYECNTAGTLSDGLDLIFDLTPCGGTPTPRPPTFTPTSVPPTVTPTPPPPTVTQIPPPPTATSTLLPTPSPTSCAMSFTDVSPSDWFYQYVLYLYCHGVVSGYNTDPPCHTGTPCFNPGGTTTRGQVSKIAVLGFEIPISTTGGPHFTDVPPNNVFYPYVETEYNDGIIAGYNTSPPCGGPQFVPCFKPNNYVTRGQLTKITVLSAQQVHPDEWQLVHPPTPTFQDVPANNAFYDYIETAAGHGIISGYPCGSPPAGACVPPYNKPYFLPLNNATRAQISKIEFLAITYTPPSGPVSR